ncbi:MAG TPA: hypothetical protein VG328_20325 [Stellaceae bacterium]|nr:hypothetical protein [Stellaceae bacterium]
MKTLVVASVFVVGVQTFAVADTTKDDALRAALNVRAAAENGINYRDFGRLVIATEVALELYIANHPDERGPAIWSRLIIANLKATLAVWRLRYEDCDNHGIDYETEIACNYIIVNTRGQSLKHDVFWLQKMAERASRLYERLDQFERPASPNQDGTFGQMVKKAAHDDPSFGSEFKWPGHKPMRVLVITNVISMMLTDNTEVTGLFIGALNHSSREPAK